MDNPVEVDFTDEGEVIGSVNILYTRPRVDALVHWLYGGAYPHRERVLEDSRSPANYLARCIVLVMSLFTGVTRYRSGVIDHRCADNHLATFFNSGKVVRVELPRGRFDAIERLQREFLSGASRDFHPTDVIEDADGSLLVVDTGGWFYRGCPTSQMSKPDVLGGIYRIRRRGMTTQVDPWGKQIDWNKLDNEQVARNLNDTRYQVKERAIVECVQLAKKNAAPTLTRALKIREYPGTPRCPLGFNTHAWPRVRTQARNQAAIRFAMKDHDASVRQIAVRSLATYPDVSALPQLLELMKTDGPSIRREAKALGRLGDKQATPALSRLASPVDRSEEHALIFALIEIGDFCWNHRGRVPTAPNTQRGAILAVEQIDPKHLKLTHVEGLLDSENIAPRSAVLQLYRQRANQAEWVQSAAGHLRKWLQNSALTKNRARFYCGLDCRLCRSRTCRESNRRCLSQTQPSDEIHQSILTALAVGHKLPLHNSWSKPLNKACNRPMQTKFSAPSGRCKRWTPTVFANGFCKSATMLNKTSSCACSPSKPPEGKTTNSAKPR